MIRRTIATAAVLALAWSILVWVTGGTVIAIAGLRVSSTNPVRPLIAAVILIAIYVFAAGRQRVHDDAALVRRLATPSRIAAVLAVAIGVIALAQSSFTASGADAYAYVTQADLLLSGRLTVPVPIANDVPWPRPLSTFVPFGYSAVANQSAIASAVGPGLPLLMALFKAIAGHPALFLVVPITAALLVWSTFAIGREMGSSALGLGAAWLVATSPAFLTMTKEPMSDVPAAAFWAVAVWMTCRLRLAVVAGVAAATVVSGVAAAIAILIRPNLVPLAATLAVWMLWQREENDLRDRLRSLVLFSIPVVLACLSIAWINNTLFGSPFSSGYGATGQLFSVANVVTNVQRYGGWLAETQTPVAVAGLFALLVSSSRLWPESEARRLGGVASAKAGALLLAAIAGTVFAIYAFYIPFDAWWFLRLLLPAWPAVGIGSAAVIIAVSQLAGARSREVHTVALVALGLYTVVAASRLNVFPDNEGERRYATIAQLVQHATEPSSLILASIHTGPLRYYAGRDTMRFDLLDEAWLDRAVAWLTAQGRHPYFLIEDWERPIFERRFAALNTLGRLDLSPVLAYRAYGIPGTVYLFDPSKPSASTLEPAPIRDPQPRCPLPAEPPGLTLRQ
ncbi:MAG TPA: glycosyltransferase family 39 protein [Vicinamibacterales bacterium]